MEKNFTLEPKDMLKFTWFVLVSNNPLQGFVILFAIAMIYLNFVFRLFLLKSWDELTHGPVLYFTVLAFLIASLIVNTIRDSKKPSRGCGECKIIVQSDGVFLHVPTSQQLIFWHTIQHFHQTKEYLYLMTSWNRAIIVPRRVFDSAKEESAFVEEIQNYYKINTQPTMVLGKSGRKGRGAIIGLIVFFLLFLITVGIVNFLTASRP